jgi:ligand-binding SRPBCC domain-containing protein
MAQIHLQTFIQADIQTCFDLARDVDVHKLSATQTNERAIAGRTSGLCELGDTITWEARHFGIRQHLTIEITRMEPPHCFEDKMLKGAFKSMKHIHSFETAGEGTRMTDHFEYVVPLGILGRFVDWLFLKQYMTKFLEKRNAVLKAFAEKGIGKS